MTTYSAVVTTGIYCRPGCGARPLAENVRTFELAASAEAAGFRACLRCRPYRIAGPIGTGTPELGCRAVQLIIDGVLDTGTETTLGARLAVSPRHLRRIFTAQLGVTPDQLARSRRAHFARRLLDDTDVTVADVAFAAAAITGRSLRVDGEPLHAPRIAVVRTPRWNEAVRFAIHAYVECNSNPMSVEASLILGQIALELLSAAILVDDLSLHLLTDFEQARIWPAARKLSALLDQCGIPTALPPSLTQLAAADERRRQSGAV